MEEVYDCNRLQKFSKELFIIYRSEHHESAYTYGGVLTEVFDVLRKFRYNNVVSNTGIALHLQDHTPSGIVMLLSILNHDCYFIPLQGKNLQPDLHTVLNAHGAKYIISDLKYEGRSSKYVVCLKVFHSIMYLYENTSIAASPYEYGQKLCYSIATSGTTGVSRIVQVPYSCVKPNIEALSAQLKLTESDVIYLCAPITFDPFVVDFFLSLNVGATLLMSTSTLRLNSKKMINVLWPNLSRGSFLKGSSEHIGTTILQATPSFFRLFGDSLIKDVILHESSSLRCLILGGEDFPTRLEWNLWLPCNSIKTRIFNIYGITELSCWSTMHECNFNVAWERAPIGDVLDDQTKLRIIDKNRIELFGVCEGKLEIGSVTRKSYIPSLDDQLWLEETEIRFRDTGDKVRRDKFGHIYYMGRIDNIIKRMGVRLNLEILQQHIQTILKTECRNVKCLWQNQKHKLICIIETTSHELKCRSMQIRRLLMKNLAKEERPDEIQFVSEFPLTLHGKIDSHCLLQKVSANTCREWFGPLDVLNNFITHSLGLNIIDVSTECPGKRIRKQPETFTGAGGTSFQAITLASEIGALLENHTDQSELLGMLLNPQKSLVDIEDFLISLSLKSKTQFTSISKVISSKLSYVNKKLRFLWRTSLNKCVDSSPIVIANKWICVGAHSHILATLDVKQGGPTAVLELPDRIECKVEVASSHNNACMALVGCYDHNIYAFNYANGRVYWNMNMGGMIKAKPLSFESRLVVATYGDEFNLLCVCLKTKSFNWRKKIGTKGIYACPVSLNDSTLIVCTLDGTYCCITKASGKCKWLRKCDSPIFSTPLSIAEEGLIVLAEVVGKVHICSTESGELLKTFCAGFPIFSGLTLISNTSGEDQWNAVRTKKIYFGCYDKHIYCLEYMKTNEEDNPKRIIFDVCWKVQLDSNIFASPIVFCIKGHNFVLSCSINGLIAVLLAETGEIVATYKLNGEIFSTPCNLNNQIFVGCRDNYIYSFCIE